MKIPKTVLIGDKNYKVKTGNFYLRKESWGGQINYLSEKIEIKKGNPKAMTKSFFHEIAHGILEEMEENFPQMIKWRNDEGFVNELGLHLKKTFNNLLKKKK